MVTQPSVWDRSKSYHFLHKRAIEIKFNCTACKISVVSIGLFLSRFVCFSYNGVGLDVLKLSVSDVIVSKKSSNGEGQ